MTKLTSLKYACTILLILVFCACANRADRPLPAHDSTAVGRGTDTETAVPGNATTPANGGPRSAVLGFSYFGTMKRQQTKNIHAFISVKNPHGAVKDTLTMLNIEDGLEKNNDTSIILTKDILVYKYVKITLLNTDSSFAIVPLVDSMRQLVDTILGNHWEWSVTATGDKPQGVLYMKVEAETPAGSVPILAAKTIVVKIDLEYNIFRGIWDYMFDNPKTVLTIIIIPIVAFFGKKLFDRKSKTSAPSS